MASKIRDVMTPAPIMLSERQTAVDAARMMKECDVGDVLVCSDDGDSALGRISAAPATA
jgi:CBS domain-containing protein